MKRTLASALALVLLAGGFMGLKARIDRMPRRKIPGSGIIYIPSGKYLKMATFGFSAVLADIIYIWAIQYYGNPAIEDRYEHLTHIFSIISELDPPYVDPYIVGALIAIEDTGDVGLALKILDAGLDKNPGQWIFPFEAGHYAQAAVGPPQHGRRHADRNARRRGWALAPAPLAGGCRDAAYAVV